jgi:ABC-type transport system involved in cytochrome bd biosynthesis fused ATPase/permease subunit
MFRKNDDKPLLFSKQIFPNDIIHCVIQYLTNDPVTLAKMQRVCKQFQNIAGDDTTWKKLYLNEFPDFRIPIKNHRFMYCTLLNYTISNISTIVRNQSLKIAIIGASGSGRNSFTCRVVSDFYAEHYDCGM